MAFAAGPRPLVRLAMTAAHRLRQIFWSMRGRPVHGVRAIVLTPEGKVVLVRQTYTQGWHLPAGGRRLSEDPQAAMLRELGEEIGLTDGRCELIDEAELLLGRRPHHLSTFAVRDAVYAPKRNLEIEAVAEFPPDALPGGISAGSGAAIRRFLEKGVA